MHDGLPDDILEDDLDDTGIEWTAQQREALSLVSEWFKGPEQVFRLFGYAGTGKTTLAQACAKRCGGTVLYGAFTGKAALVLQQKGAHDASTIHRLIYTPKDKSSIDLAQMRENYNTELMRDLGEKITKKEQAAYEKRCRELAREITKEEERLKQPAFVLNPDSDVQDANLVIIDEVSMVGRKMATDLLSFGTKVLVLGDPAQLPPVGDGGYFTNVEPDVLLTEIHRQEEGSPIVELATQVRKGETLTGGEYGESAVLPKGSLDIHAIAKFDQILVGRNKTRHIINRRIREEVLGRLSPLPTVGDRLVCLRNNHELGLLNGSLWVAQEVNAIEGEDTMLLKVKGEDGREVDTLVHTGHFVGKEIPFRERRNADEFDHGIALTVHKAQGSQWGSVFVVDESSAFRQDAARWLYTAITRASERVVIVR